MQVAELEPAPVECGARELAIAAAISLPVLIYRGPHLLCIDPHVARHLVRDEIKLADHDSVRRAAHVVVVARSDGIRKRDDAESGIAWTLLLRCNRRV
jgi:hypothetical protein